MARLAAIGDSTTVLAFDALGVEGVTADSPQEAREAVSSRLTDEYAALFVTEAVYEAAAEEIAEAADRAVPAVTVIPHAGGPAGAGEAKLARIIVKAVGSELVARDEDGQG
jgi:V/A-type H+-transporting ATPase subunit F